MYHLHLLKPTALNFCLNKQLLADAGGEVASATSVSEDVQLTMIVRISDHAPPG
jgi:hypothetical protein